MGTHGSETRNQETLQVVAEIEPPGTPLTTSEVAESLGCARRTAYNKLETLAEEGELETKKVGARGRVWWRPVDEPRTEGSGAVFEEAQFQELVSAISDYAIFVLDSEGYVQTWNDGAEQIKGYDEDEIVGEHFSAFYTEADREVDRPGENLAGAAEEGRIEDEGWRVRVDGSRFWANVTITALRDDDGEVRGFIKITRDMTERHEYEEQLRREKDRFETLVREVKDYAIFLLDAEGHVQTWNDGATQLKGYDEDEIVGDHFSAFYTEADREAGRPGSNLEAAERDGRVEDEGERVRKDGTTFWANVTITALYDEGGEVRGYAKVTRDMTERHEYEEKLREQRDELEELNQINTVIREIDQSLVGAETREEIEQAVCDRLAGSTPYTAAWIGEYSEDYEDVTLRTGAGVTDDYVDAIRAADSESAEETEKGVGATALKTRTIQPVQRLQLDDDGEPWRGASLEEGYESAVSVPLVFNDVEYGILMVYADHESAFDQRKIAVMSEMGETISHAIAAIRRKERERTLTALQESTRELLRAETPEEVGEVIVETLTDDLTLADALVYHFNTMENTLDPVSSSFRGDSYAQQLAPMSATTDSPLWTTFMEGDARITESSVTSRALGPRRSFVVPLGDHGVLAVAAAEGESFDRDTCNLVTLVATTAEAAFDRLESQANLRERDELLQEQNQRLQQLNQINTIIREVDQGLVQATTRDEVERVICDRLTASDRFRFAWIGTPDDVEGGITPRAWSGDARGYLDSVELRTKPGKDQPEPAVTAAETGDMTVVSNVADHLHGGPWRREAFTREFQSIISVPLEYGDVTYGVFSVYADRPDVFDEMERSVFGELGETIANAIHAVDTQQALLSEHVVELEFRLQDESTSFLARIARQLGCEITVEGVIPLSENRARMYFVVHDTSADAIEDAFSRSVAVESGEVVASRDEGRLIEAVVSGSTVPLALAEHGASLRSLVAADDGIRLTVDLPSSMDVRGFIERFQSKYESAEFVARHQRERTMGTRDRLYTELDDHLTDRQFEVLKTAYYSGYFVSPRQSTGGDIADRLDVSQPTVTEQLRTAQCKVLDLLFAEAPMST